MISKDILFKWFHEMIVKYNNIRFLYNYNEKFNSHYIAVFPSEITDEEDYCKFENSIYDKLSSKFQNESFVFGIESKNFKITDDFIEYSAHSIPNYNCISDIDTDNLYSINESFRSNSIIIRVDNTKSEKSNTDKSSKIPFSKVIYQLKN